MDDGSQIGTRARRIRKRRGLSLDVVAGLAGVSKGQLSKLERGARPWIRRGLIENVADALGCSPSDLTGVPDISRDRRAVEAAGAVPALAAALFDTTLDDVPDIPTRPVGVLAKAARAAYAAADEVRYDLPGPAFGDLLAELHVVAATGRPEDARTALVGIFETCFAASSFASTLGRRELAVVALRRAWDAATRLNRPDLIGFTAMGRSVVLNRVGARRRARGLLDATLVRLDAEPGPSVDDTATGEARGMVHLAAAQLAARDGRSGDVDTHLGQARELATFLGERNAMDFHFGPTNVEAWALALAVEQGTGAEHAERVADTVRWDTLASRDRLVNVHFDLARAYAQDGGARDLVALRHLDQADRIAPLRVRQDPVTVELVEDLERRATRRTWELTSMKRRLGVA